MRWQDLDLENGAATIARNWDWRGKLFTPPKTAAGVRTVALSQWLIEALKVHQGSAEINPWALVFATETGGPMNPSNVRRDIWLKLVARAGVRPFDLYSLRHTFASRGRTAGESAFNVARMMGHSRSSLVDDSYAQALPSGMASVAARVTARVLGEPVKLKITNGGRRTVRRSLDVR